MNLLTLATVRQQLWQNGPSKVPYATATTAQKALFDAKLNEVIEHYMVVGRFKHMLRRFNIPIYYGHITMPRHLSHCVGVRALESTVSWSIAIYTRFREFAESSSCDECTDGVKPVSELVQSFITPTLSFRLKVKGGGTEGNVSLIGGRDEEGDEFLGSNETVTLAITSGSTGNTTTRVYSSMPQIQKPVTVNPVELYAVDANDTELLIAVYAPGETVPAYQRYEVPNYGDSVTMVRALCKMAFVPVVADTDIVYPSSIRALKLGLMAVEREDVLDTQQANALWAQGEEFLIREREENDTGTTPIIQVDGSFGAGPMPWIM